MQRFTLQITDGNSLISANSLQSEKHLSDLQELHRAKIKQLQAEMDESEASYKQAVKELKQKQQNEKDEIERTSQERLAAIEDRFKLKETQLLAKVTGLAEDLRLAEQHRQREADEYSSRVDELTRSRDVTVHDLTEKNNAEMTSLQQKHDEYLTSLRSEHESLMREEKSRVTAEVERSREVLVDMESSYRERIRILTLDSKDSKRKLNQQVELYRNSLR